MVRRRCRIRGFLLVVVALLLPLAATADGYPVTWTQFYLVDGSVGCASTGDGLCSAGTVIGFTGSLNRFVGVEFAAAGFAQPGGAGRGRHTVLPIYVHFWPMITWHERGGSPRFVTDLYLGGSAWANSTPSSDDIFLLGKSSYLHGGARWFYNGERDGATFGIDLGAVLSQPVEDAGDVDVSVYVGLSASFGMWLCL